MKTENEKLKEMFAENLGQREDTPDFERMWQMAAERNKNNRFWVWRIAASVVLIVTVGTMVILHRQDSRGKSATQITSWSEPTGVLLPSPSDIPLTALSHWASPTRLLLPDNDHFNKNKIE